MLKKLSTFLRIGTVGLAGACALVAITPVPALATELPIVPNTPTRITVTKIDLNNNKFWVRFDEDMQMFSEAKNYLHLLGISANTGGAMSDEILGGLRYSQDGVGTPLTFIYNVPSRTTSFLPSEIPYEFTPMNGLNLKNLTTEWYYWALISGDSWVDDDARGRIDFTECAEVARDQMGYTCQAEMGSDGLYHYVPYDADNSRIKLPSEIAAEEAAARLEAERLAEEERLRLEAEEQARQEEERLRLEEEERQRLEAEERARQEVEASANVEDESKTEAKVVEVIKEVPVVKTLTKVVTEEVPIEKTVYVAAENTTTTDGLINKGEAEESKDDFEKNVGDAAEISLETAEETHEAEVPYLSGSEVKQSWNYWWVVVLALVASAMFALIAVLKRSRDEE